jgi:hypothetical protein
MLHHSGLWHHVAGFFCLGCDDVEAKEKGEILEVSRMESPEG